jgi:hypothetical protein
MLPFRTCHTRDPRMPKEQGLLSRGYYHKRGFEFKLGHYLAEISRDAPRPLRGESKLIRFTGGGWRTPSGPQGPFLFV